MKKNIAIFVHHPMCSIESVNGIMKALAPTYNIKVFTKHKLPEEFFDDVELVVFPGGVGDASSFGSLLKANLDDVKKFLSLGGKYLGICMGAYWADKYYFDILNDTRVIQHIKRARAEIRSSYATTTNINWRGDDHRMYFYDGPTYIGGEFEQVASYSNGDPMAIVQGPIGLIGCHLESEQSWYQKKYMQPYWHNHTHHTLLLQFVVDYLLDERQMALF
ncbi:MAG: BPL-N domain-containing protein [Burkholderiaceae bacterium]